MGIHWEHEDASQMMFEYLIDENHIDSIDSSDSKFIQSLIKGEKPANVDSEKLFIAS
jgi:hypothetical protein